MRMLLVHNYYQQAGGEDVVFESEAELLRLHNHEVSLYTRDNEEIQGMSGLGVAANAIWSRRSRGQLAQLIREKRPDVVHFHNTFPLLSPSVYGACRDAGVPVVQTLHNYRLLCLNGFLFRDGHVCEECLGHALPWPGVAHRCYRQSLAGSATVASMLSVHRWIKTWNRQVDAYIALTEFSRQKFITAGLPAQKIVVKPNFVISDEGPAPVAAALPAEHGYALFVGRLSPEKGVLTLLKAWQKLRNIALKIVGDGPSMPEARDFADQSGLEAVQILGQLAHDEVLTLLGNARFLVMPSEWYEMFPMALVEAFAQEIPVIAPRLGAVAEIVIEGSTGLLFRPGDVDDLAAKVQWAWEHPDEMAVMGGNAGREYQAKYTAQRNYELLMDVYQTVIEGAQMGH